ncbi:MAG: 2OG-Fe(II) oxygenase [Myxococcota bacterium]
MRRLLDGDAIVLDALLTPDECTTLIARSEALGFGEAPINAPTGVVRRPEVRNNDRVIVDDDALANELWTKLRPRLPEPFLTLRLQGLCWDAVSLNERLRFYRYTEGQQFRWHRDGAFRRSPEEVSLFTVLIYLSEAEGGATRFHTDAVTPTPGRVLIFWHPTLHQGDPVLGGHKYVLRTDIMFRRDA